MHIQTLPQKFMICNTMFFYGFGSKSWNSCFNFSVNYILNKTSKTKILIFLQLENVNSCTNKQNKMFYFFFLKKISVCAQHVN